MQQLRPTTVLAILGAFLLSWPIPGGNVALIKIDRLTAQRQDQLNDYSLVEEELSLLRHNPIATDAPTSDFPNLVAMR